MFGYDSIYFDTAGLRCFWDHVEGTEPRFKARSRLYEETGASYFETEIKMSDGSTRRRQLDTDSSEHGELTGEMWDFLVSALDSCGMAPPERLQPSLATRFRRSTVVAVEGGERVTADRRVEMVRPDGASFRIRDGRLLVETKSESGEGALDAVLRDSGYESVSVSKYRVGIALLAADDPANPLGADLERYFERSEPRAESGGA